MSRLNKIILVGEINSQPQISTTSTGDSKTSFTITVGRPTAENTTPQSDTISIVLWRDLADKAATFLTGQSVLVEGSIHNRSYENNEGQRVYITEVEGRQCSLLTPSQQQHAQPSNQPIQEQVTPPAIEEPVNKQEATFDFNEAIKTSDDNAAFANELGEDVPF